MSVHGSLLTMPLSELLVWIEGNRHHGLITVMRDQNEWELTVEDSAVTGYLGPELRDNLGHIVVTSGMLTEEDLRAAYQRQRKSGASLQQTFLSNGMLTRLELEEVLRELAIESIYDLFLPLPGTFVFTPAITGGLGLELDGDERLPLDLHINQLLMEGARRQDEWSQIRQRFPRDDIRVTVIHDQVPPLESLGVRKRRVLASLSAGQSISDICLEMRVPIPSVLRIIAEFERLGAVEIDNESTQPDERPRTQRVEELAHQAAVMSEANQFDEAITLLEVAVRMRPTDPELRDKLKEVVVDQIQNLYGQLPPVRIPVVIANDDKLQKLRLRPDERFLLDRLAARMDVGSLVMVSSLSERETLKVLRKLLHSGIIELE